MFSDPDPDIHSCSMLIPAFLLQLFTLRGKENNLNNFNYKRTNPENHRFAATEWGR